MPCPSSPPSFTPSFPVTTPCRLGCCCLRRYSLCVDVVAAPPLFLVLICRDLQSSKSSGITGNYILELVVEELLKQRGLSQVEVKAK